MEYTFHYFLIAWFFMLGAVVGSFLNVVIYRVPLGQSIVSPGSRCPHCHSDIRAYDNIPLVSYLLLCGRCRDCGARISVRYPLIELITALLAAALYLKWTVDPAVLVYFSFCAAMVAVFWIDVDYMVIPDVISINGLALGVIFSTLGLIPEMDLKLSLIGLFMGGAILYIPAAVYERLRGIEGLGGGDIKLLAMIGAFMGPYGVVFVLFFSSLFGTAFALASMALRGTSSTTPIPFGPFLASAAVAYVFVGPELVALFQSVSFPLLGAPEGPDTSNSLPILIHS
jgi:leader peptidase (prepilin peptidase) / N-methyltransferase